MVAEPKVGQGRISQDLLTALVADEEMLWDKYGEYQAAFQDDHVARRRFAAMREAVRKRLSMSPYAPRVGWPKEAICQNNGRLRRRPGARGDGGPS